MSEEEVNEDSGSILGDAPAEGEPKPEATGTVEDGWLKGVENEWAQDSSMQNIKSVADLAKGYVHAQRLVGKDKIVMPNEHSTPEEKKAFYQKLGLPENVDGYGISHSDESSLSEDTMKDFVAKAHEVGIMPEAAKSMLAWHEANKVAEAEAANTAYAKQVETTISELKQEYGQAFEAKVNMANTVLDKVASPEQIQAMRDSGMLNDKNFITTLVGIAESMSSEAGFDINPKSDGRLSPSEADRRIKEIRGDFSHAYHNSAHPNHENAVKEVTDLYTMLG